MTAPKTLIDTFARTAIASLGALFFTAVIVAAAVPLAPIA